MKCPNCKSSNYRVMDTFNGPDEKIYRGRKCLICGQCFRTVEVADDGSDEFKKSYYEAQQSKSPLSTLRRNYGGR